MNDRLHFWNMLYSALVEFGDTTHLVEYWSRDEFMNIDVHAHITDEVQTREEGVMNVGTY